LKGVLTAEAETQKKIASADGEAESILRVAKAQAEANRLLAESLTTQLVELKRIEKLNPNVQMIYVPSNANIFTGEFPLKD